MMIRWAIRDYFSAFRWQNLKETYKKGAWWWLLYFLGVLPALIMEFETWESTLTFYCVMVPVIFCVAAEGIHSTILPKMMYLCPMSMEMRKKYIMDSIFVRVVIPIMVGLCAVMVLILNGICDWIGGFGILLNLSSLAICLGMCLCVNGPSRISRNGTISSNAGLLEIFIILVSLITGLLYASWLQGISDIFWLKWGFLIVEVLVQVPMILSYLKRWRNSIEQALIYENSFAGNKENRE